MASYTIYANTDDYAITSANANWATSRAGSGLASATGGTSYDIRASDNFSGSYICREALLHFDTSAVAGTPSAIALVLAIASIAGGGDTLEAMEKTWSGTGTGNWVAGASLVQDYGPTTVSGTSAQTLTKVSTSLSLSSTYGLLLFVQRQRTSVPGASGEQVGVRSADTSGTTNDPYLSITTVTSTNHPGAGAFSGAGTFTGAGQIVKNGSAAFSGTGSFTANATFSLGGRASFAGVGTFAGSGRLAAQGSASFVGTGTFAGNGNAALSGAALFAGVGTFTAASALAMQGSGSFAATSRFIANPKLRILQRSIGRLQSPMRHAGTRLGRMGRSSPIRYPTR